MSRVITIQIFQWTSLLHFAGMTLVLKYGQQTWMMMLRQHIWAQKHPFLLSLLQAKYCLARGQLGIGAPNHESGLTGFIGTEKRKEKKKREKEEKEKKREKRKEFAFLLFKSVYKLFLQAAQLPDEYAYSSKALNSFTSAGIGASGKLVEREKQLSEKNSEVIGFFCLSFWYQHTLRSGKSWCSCAAPFGGTSS